MACFLVPGTEAIVVTAAALLLRRYEQKKTEVRIQSGAPAADITEKKPGFSRRLMWLASLLWGGVALLAFEHLWHGEVVPFFPFLTAATEGAGAVAEMLHEMGTVGVTMAILVTAVWGAMVAVSYYLEKRPLPEKSEVTA